MQLGNLRSNITRICVLYMYNKPIQNHGSFRFNLL